MSQYAFYFDQSRCYACHACSVACKDWNGIEPGPEKWMAIYEWEDGAFPDLRAHTLAFNCGHCDNAVCMQACPNKAIFREGKYGAVLVNQDLCDGCRKCYEACPYGAPKFASDAPGTKMSKCTMCYDRLEKGDKPLCVESCPLRAFDFGTKEEMEAKYGTCRQLEGMPEPTTKPNFIVKENAPKKQLLPYDGKKAQQLLQQRGHLGTVFESVEDLEDKEGLVRKKELKMKYDSMQEFYDATRGYYG